MWRNGQSDLLLDNLLAKTNIIWIKLDNFFCYIFVSMKIELHLVNHFRRRNMLESKSTGRHMHSVAGMWASVSIDNDETTD